MHCALTFVFLGFNQVTFCLKFHFQMVVRQNKVRLICIKNSTTQAYGIFQHDRKQLQVSLSCTCKYFEVIIYIVICLWPPSAQIKWKWRHAKVKNWWPFYGPTGSWVEFYAVNSMLITGTITAKQKVRQKVPGLYAVCR